MQIKSQKDFWSGLMFIVVGVAFAWGSLNYSFGSSARPGPAYFPFGLGVLMAILGAFVLFGAMTVETEDGDRIGAWSWRPLIIVIASLVGFGLGLPRLGLLITLPLLVFVVSLAGDEFHWKDALLNAAILTGMSWAIFVKGLSLTLPVWPTIFAAAAATGA
ncbi:tripartite tricarboxylate transporter TctB family protein [Sphaerotilus mobilis]|uniref:Tripartite tricarboxylate transporter TctB family protein n=1 Tax=Sphaerotilus mobilis TaxID=47994 RepID=A0A4Q7LRQ5_9BURK|nr:tripartite tricarboxylate transporter TctB family protein [Sphaerotilus mobilis]RZS57181.1 tripartite tricarboxylate transporter TctB family protein [Sphaerotilus mobilis]